MRLLVIAIAFLLLSCANGPDDPGGPMLGSWTYTQGTGEYFCDDGQAGHLSVNVGSVATITHAEDDAIRITYEGACPDGFTFRHGDEEAEGWISQADVCRYSDANAFGNFDVTLSNTSDSSLSLSADESTLKDKVEHVYLFEYEDFTQRCQVFSVGYAKRVGVD